MIAAKNFPGFAWHRAKRFVMKECNLDDGIHGLHSLITDKIQVQKHLIELALVALESGQLSGCTLQEYNIIKYLHGLAPMLMGRGTRSKSDVSRVATTSLMRNKIQNLALKTQEFIFKIL